MRRITSTFRRWLGSGTTEEHAPPVPVPEIFRRFWPQARPYRWWLALGLLVAAAISAIEALEIYLFKVLVDEVLVPRELLPLVWITLAAVGLNLASGLLSFADEYLTTWAGQRFITSIRIRLYGHLVGSAPDSLDRRRLGDVLARVTADVSAIEELVVGGLSEAISAGLRILFFAGALFLFDWRLALVSLVAAPLFWLAARRLANLIRATARERRRRGGSLTSAAEQGLSNLALVQASNRQDSEVARFGKENDAAVRARLAATRIRGIFHPLVDLLELAGGILVVAFGTWALADGRLTLGALLAFLTYLTQLYRPVRDLADLGDVAFTASAAAERVIELLEERTGIEDRPHARHLHRARGAIRVRDVRFSYPQSSGPALDTVSFDVEPGEAVALMGPSGAGKSTMVKLLLRFQDVDRGEIRLDGHDIRDLTLTSLRNTISVLFQEAPILEGTVRDNIAFGRPEATDEQIVAAARAAGAHGFISELPLGYDAVVGHRGRRLSGGERQRIAIARALLQDAPVLVLDEPGTGLDAEATRRIVGPLQRLMKGRATLLITHDPLLARQADRILVLDDGRIVEPAEGDDPLGAGGTYTGRWVDQSDERMPSGTMEAVP
jgi:subfamily B ATP-binding cassette protein MsbA